jgi:hypothetical protein
MIELKLIIPIVVASLAIILPLFVILYLKIKHLNSCNVVLTANYNRILSQKKSSEVRLGRIGENMAPFFEAWPFDPNNFKFLGNPVDGISFEPEAIHFMEIKTGKARLTDSQKNVRRLIKEGKVYFSTFRVDESGCSFKIEED